MRCGKGVRAARAQRRRQVHRYQDPDHVGPLVLDEPTTGLDPEARAALWQEIGDLASSGMTILLTTRYLEEADRLTIVDKGTVIVDGTPG